jgi:predicted PurR-regulated permease PerM
MSFLKKKYLKNIAFASFIILFIILIIKFVPGVVLGIISAYTLNSIVRILKSYHISQRPVIILIIFTLTCFIIISFVAIFPLLVFEITEIIKLVPKIVSKIYEFILEDDIAFSAVNNTSIVYKKIYEEIKKGEVSNLIDIVKPLFSFFFKHFPNFASGFLSSFYSFSTFLISTVVFFININNIYDFFIACIPTENRNILQKQQEVFNELFSLFLTNQMKNSIMNSVFFTILVKLIGVPFSISLGSIVFFSSFAPYFGSVIGAIGLFSILLLINASIKIFISACVVILLSYILENYILVPHFLGEKIGLHPLLIIVVMPIIVRFFGIFGSFLVVPIILYLRLALQYFFENYAVFSLTKNNIKKNKDSYGYYR